MSEDVGSGSPQSVIVRGLDGGGNTMRTGLKPMIVRSWSVLIGAACFTQAAIRTEAFTVSFGSDSNDADPSSSTHRSAPLPVLSPLPVLKPLDAFTVSFGPITTGLDLASSFPQTVNVPQWNPATYVGYDLQQAELTFTATFQSDVSFQNLNGVPSTFTYTLPLTSFFTYPVGAGTTTLMVDSPDITGSTPVLAPNQTFSDTKSASHLPAPVTVSGASLAPSYIGSGTFPVGMDGLLGLLSIPPNQGSGKPQASNQFIEMTVSIVYTFIPESANAMAAGVVAGLLGFGVWRARRRPSAAA